MKLYDQLSCVNFLLIGAQFLVEENMDGREACHKLKRPVGAFEILLDRRKRKYRNNGKMIDPSPSMLFGTGHVLRAYEYDQNNETASTNIPCFV